PGWERPVRVSSALKRTIVTMIPFDAIRNSHQSKWSPEKRFTGILLALDPGETTGVAIFDATLEKVTLRNVSQIKTWPFDVGVAHIQGLIKGTQPKFTVFERYGIYGWKT